FGGHASNRVGNLLLHAGYAFARDVINETSGAFGDKRDAFVGSGWRYEVDVAQTGFAHEGFVIFAFLVRQIEDEQAIHSGASSVSYELFHADFVNQVEIDVKDHGDLRLLTDGSDGF